MTRTQQIDAAMQKLQDDPLLAKQFDESRKIDFPQAKTRREACELGLKAIEAHRNSSLAKVRAKAMAYTAKTATAVFKKAIASITPKPRADKRQAPLQISDWHTQHVMQAAEKGDPVAIAEIQRRGYEINGTSFTKKA
jgi:short subunit dehydrogenase-like uncharacterized protein